jgi:hypothetical protein
VRKSEIFSLEHSDLNGFLFSAIGREPSGVTLSVVSFLARLDVDPWREAGAWRPCQGTRLKSGSPRQSPAPQRASGLFQRPMSSRLAWSLCCRATRQAAVVNKLVSVLRGSGTGDRNF